MIVVDTSVLTALLLDARDAGTIVDRLANNADAPLPYIGAATARSDVQGAMPRDTSG